jgi:hypothetical protein
MLNHLLDEIRKTPGLSFLNDPNIQGGELKVYADASNTAIGGLITVKKRMALNIRCPFIQEPSQTSIGSSTSISWRP